MPTEGKLIPRTPAGATLPPDSTAPGPAHMPTKGKVGRREERD
jgi:hypothetical protein